MSKISLKQAAAWCGGTVEEFRIGGHGCEKGLAGTVVRDVAPSLSRDAQLFPGEGIAFENRHLRTARGSLIRRHHPGRAAADHANTRHFPASSVSVCSGSLFVWMDFAPLPFSVCVSGIASGRGALTLV